MESASGNESAVGRKRFMGGRRMRYLVAAAAVAVVSPLAMQLAPAKAAGTHDVWIVGSTIPADVQCISVGVPSQGLDVPVTPGQDKQTVLLVQEGETVVYRRARDAGCTDYKDLMPVSVRVPEGLTTDHFWLGVA